MGVKRPYNVTSQILVILLISPMFLQTVRSSETEDNDVENPYQNVDLDSTARIFYSALGDVLMRVPFLPITLNVPNTISTVSSIFSYFFGSSEPSSDEPRVPNDVMKLVRSALELTNFENLEEEMFF